MAAHKGKILQALSGFEDISRYWDPSRLTVSAKILPGEYYVTKNNEIICTVLGSCISACIRDPVAGIGGMNHYMLPYDKNNPTSSASRLEANRYGNWAMENLINTILKNGGMRNRLEIKLFGGSSLMDASSLDVGKTNIDFIRKYLETEQMGICVEDLGGPYPRKVVYCPKTGKVFIKKLESLQNRTLLDREKSYRDKLKTGDDSATGSVELF